jgi:hypothetical protein
MSVLSSIGEKKKDKFDEYSLVAKGDIPETDNFFIYPNVTYKGEADLYGKNPYLFFKGYAKINFKNPDVTTTDFKIIDDINPDTLFLHYDSTTKSSDGSRIVTGIYFNKMGETPAMYHALFTQIQHSSDLCMFKAPGIVTYNAKTNEYLIGDEDKITKGALAGNLLRYNDDKGIIKGEGEMSLGADFQVIRSAAAGTLEADIKKKQYTFNMTFGLDMKTGNKALDEKFQTIMVNDNTDLPDINYEGDRFKKIYSQIADPKVDDKLIKNLETVPAFVRPKNFDYYLVFSDVNFIYDADDLTLRSYGKIGVAFVGDKGIHKRLDGYIEIGLKNNNFNIYLKTGANEWFFFEYKPGSLGLMSSYDDYTRIIGTIIMTPSDKRKITGDKNQFYSINLGSSINKGAFLDAMKDKNSPLLPLEKVRPKLPKDTTAIKAPRGGDTPKADTAAVIPPKPAKTIDTAAAAQQKKEDALTPAQRRAARLRSKAGQDQPAPVPVPAVVDSSAIRQQEAPKAMPVSPPVDTSKAIQSHPAIPVDTPAKTIKQPPVSAPVPVDTANKVNQPHSALPVIDTVAKAAKQPDITTPVSVPAATVADTATKVGKKPAAVGQAAAPVDTMGNLAKAVPVVPVVPNPAVPIDSSSIKQQMSLPTDTTNHK